MFKSFLLLLIVVGVSFLSYQEVLKKNHQKAEDVVSESPSLSEPSVREETIVKDLVKQDLVLDLSSKGLTQTPAYVFGESNIQKLDLSNNQLTGSLQAEIRHLQNLKVLDLSNNKFTGVPAEVGQLVNLEILDLSNNLITGLPLELSNLSNLKTLNLRGNNYSEYDLNLIKAKLPNSVEIIQ